MAKDSQKTIELKAKIEELERVNKTLNETIFTLEQEKKQVLQGSSTVLQSDYEGLLKQLEREKQSAEQYKNLYSKEKTKRNELKKRFNTDKENFKEQLEEKEKFIETLRGTILELQTNKEDLPSYPASEEIEELRRKLSRKGTGKPRNNKTTDEDVLRLRNEGKTIRGIVALTGLSTATITKILKKVN
jgi:DNA repair exonuclease SbcCD ATPase subunit